MSPFSRHALAAAALAIGTLASNAQAALIYSLNNTGSALVRFDSAAPNAVTTLGGVGGGVKLDALDFRPSDGKLYGFSSATGGIYTLDTTTGKAALVSSTPTANLLTPSFTGNLVVGIDFNPVPDRLRVVANSGSNLRINPAVSGAAGVAVDTALSYASPTSGEGSKPPTISDAAYTNNVAGATATKLYYLDHGRNALMTTAAPNGGILSTVGMGLGFDIEADSSIDILTAGGVDTAYARLNVGGINGLYTINLATGAATQLGKIGANVGSGLAVALEAPAAVPEPGSLALVGLAGMAAFATRRRRA